MTDIFEIGQNSNASKGVAAKSSPPNKALRQQINLASQNQNVNAFIIDAIDRAPFTCASIASSSLMNEDLLDQLSQMNNVAIRINAARNDSSLPKTLERLAEDENDIVRECVAGNPATPKSVLENLLQDSKLDIRWQAAANPSASEALLERLVADKDVRSAVAFNPSAGSELIKQLVRDPDGYTRKHVAANVGADEAVLKRLIKDDDYEVCQALSANPKAGPRILKKLYRLYYRFQDSNPVVYNPSAGPSILRKLAHINDYAVAQNPSAGAKLLEELYEKECSVNPSETVFTFSDPFSFSVREGIAGNPAASEELLTKISETRVENTYIRERIREQLAGNPSAALITLEHIADSCIDGRGNWNICDKLIRNQALPREKKQEVIKAWMEHEKLQVDGSGEIHTSPTFTKSFPRYSEIERHLRHEGPEHVIIGRGLESVIITFF